MTDLVTELVGDQPVGSVTNLWEQRFKSVFVFPDEYRTILTWAAPLKIPGIFVRGQQKSHRNKNCNIFQSCQYAY